MFIDPIGTGFSRARIEGEEAKKQFFNPKADVDYLSRTIYDWLVANGRLLSRKYLVGESYSGFRVPRIAHTLQTQMGIALNGTGPWAPP